MRQMTAADLNTDRPRTAALAIPNDDDTQLLWPYLKRPQTPADRVIEAARRWSDLDSMDIFDDDFLDASEARNGALKQALDDLDQHTG